MAIPDPTGKSYEEWARGMTLEYPGDDLANWDVLPWQEWAVQLFQRVTFGTLALPDPRIYSDWRDYAQALRESVG